MSPAGDESLPRKQGIGHWVAALGIFSVAYAALTLIGHICRLGDEQKGRVQGDDATLQILGDDVVVTIDGEARQVTITDGGESDTWPKDEDDAFEKVVTILGDEEVAVTLGLTRMAVFWPSLGFAFGVLLVAPRRVWPAILAAVALLETLFFLVFFRDMLASGSSWWWAVALLAGLVCAAQALLAASLVRWRLGVRAGRWGRRSALGIVGAGILAAACGGIIAAVTVWLAARDVVFNLVLLQRFFSDGIGLILVAPLVLAWADATWQPKSWRFDRKFAEAALFFLLTVFVAALVFGGVLRLKESPFHHPYLIYPLFIWGSLRLHPRVVMAALFLTVVILVLTTQGSSGPFSMPWEPVKELFSVQAFAAVMAVATAILCAVVSDHKRARSELRRTNEQLAKSEERFRLAIEAVGEGAYDLDVPTGKVYVSERWLSSLGYSREDAPPLFSFWESLLHPDDKQRVMHQLQEHLAGRTEQFDVEYRLRTKSGEYRWTRDRGRVVARDDEGQPLRMVGTEDDVTVRRTAEDQLAHLERKLAHVARLSTMGELVASIAHEVNQPLFSIVNFAKAAGRRLASEEPPDVDALRELNEQIAECAVRAGAIIKRLRSFVSRGEPHRDRDDTNRLVRGACEMMEFTLRRAGVRVAFELTDDLPQVLVDGVQIQQVLVNLLQNACDALEAVAQADRNIQVRTRQLGDMVAVIVSDTGPGLPDDTGLNLFDSFVTTKPEGLGMGLPISKTIVEAHGGKLLAAGREGGGAEFLFTLPTETQP